MSRVTRAGTGRAGSPHPAREFSNADAPGDRSRVQAAVDVANLDRAAAQAERIVAADAAKARTPRRPAGRKRR